MFLTAEFLTGRIFVHRRTLPGAVLRPCACSPTVAVKRPLPGAYRIFEQGTLQLAPLRGDSVSEIRLRDEISNRGN